MVKTTWNGDRGVNMARVTSFTYVETCEKVKMYMQCM